MTGPHVLPVTPPDPPTPSAAPSPQPTPAKADGMPPGAIFMAILAVILVGVGFVVMFTYTDGDGPVGGDAYNYQIRALWGLGWMSGGIVSGLIAVAASVGQVVRRVSSLAASSTPPAQ